MQRQFENSVTLSPSGVSWLMVEKSSDSILRERYRAAMRNYIDAATRLQNTEIAEFSAAHRAAQDARAEFERLRAELRRASHRQDLDAGV
jgi:hypothetical protein